MSNGKVVDETHEEEPYTPEPGSILAEAKWVADEEGFLEAVGATDEEEHRRKLHEIEEDDYRNAYQEYLRDQFRDYVLDRRMGLGQLSPKFSSMHINFGSGKLGNMCYAREREATGRLTLEEWQQEGKYYQTEVNARISFYTEVFPELPAYIERQTQGKVDVTPRDLIKALDEYLDGEDLPRSTSKVK